ncbi:MAG: DUF3549 family protein [Pseudomonadales bacterium]|nr:DUF3549 family protein [Pseudomonadales bacterium]
MHTLINLIEQSGAQYRIYDMGRAIRKIDRDLFKKFEAAEVPYPYPFQGHAWFAVLFWSPQAKQEHQIWFVKFPLDEQGLLKQACRDDFIKRTIDEIAQRQSQDQSAPTESDNPWGFTPHQDKMAAIHAKSSVAMGFAASQFYEPVLSFLQHPDDQWQSLGIQGIADFCARLDENDNEALVINALGKMPSELLIAFLPHLLPHLENESISHRLAEAILGISEIRESVQLLSAGIRALSQSSGSYLHTLISEALTSPHQNSVEVLVSISGRAWDALEDPQLALQFLEALARNDAGQQGFNHILRDILYLPKIGPVIREAFRSEERSDSLISVLGEFLKDVH